MGYQATIYENIEGTEPNDAIPYDTRVFPNHADAAKWAEETISQLEPETFDGRSIRWDYGIIKVGS